MHGPPSRRAPRVLAGATTIVLLVAACATSGTPASQGASSGEAGAATPLAWIARMDSGRTRVRPADVDFMRDARRSALTQPGAELDGSASSAADDARVRTLASVVRDLGGAR